jgi:hypothetical protein
MKIKVPNKQTNKQTKENTTEYLLPNWISSYFCHSVSDKEVM